MRAIVAHPHRVAAAVHRPRGESVGVIDVADEPAQRVGRIELARHPAQCVSLEAVDLLLGVFDPQQVEIVVAEARGIGVDAVVDERRPIEHVVDRPLPGLSRTLDRRVPAEGVELDPRVEVPRRQRAVKVPEVRLVVVLGQMVLRILGRQQPAFRVVRVPGHRAAGESYGIHPAAGA